MHIERRGRGPAVVFVHGLPQPPNTLWELAEPLSADHEVFVVHLPGYGKSKAPEGDYCFASVRQELLVELKGLGVTSCVFVGISGGAYRSFDIALDPPDWLSVDGVVALGPVAGLPDDEQRAAFRGFADLVASGADLGDLFKQRALSAPWIEAYPEEALALGNAYMTSASRETLAAELKAFADLPDRTSDLSALECPVYIRVGEVDPATPPAWGTEILKHAKSARMDVVPGAGHLLQVEDRDGTVASIRAFVVEAQMRQCLEDAVNHPETLGSRVTAGLGLATNADYATIVNLHQKDELWHYGSCFFTWGSAEMRKLLLPRVGTPYVGNDSPIDLGDLPTDQVDRFILSESYFDMDTVPGYVALKEATGIGEMIRAVIHLEGRAAWYVGLIREEKSGRPFEAGIVDGLNRIATALAGVVGDLVVVDTPRD